MAKHDESWNKLFHDYSILEWNFDDAPFEITADQIKESCQGFKKTTEKEVRVLCKQDSRDDRPQVFIDNGLFILPIKNGKYNIVKGEGYVTFHL